MKNLLTDEDGWYEILDHPQQHYFFKKHSLCGKYQEFPAGAHHDNDPLKHCQKCTQITRKLMAVASSIAGVKLNTRQVFLLIEQLDKIDLSKGVSQKEVFAESTIAVVTSQKTGKKTTHSSGLMSKKKSRTLK